MGFGPNCITTAEGTNPFIERILSNTYLFQDLNSGNLFWVLWEFFSRDPFVLYQAKHKGYNSFWWSDKSLVYYDSAEASGYNRRHISFSWDLRVDWSCCRSVPLFLKWYQLKYSDIFIKYEKELLCHYCKAQLIFVVIALLLTLLRPRSLHCRVSELLFALRPIDISMTSTLKGGRGQMWLVCYNICGWDR